MSNEKQIIEHIYKKAETLVQNIYDVLPDGINEHADGKLYFHQTYYDPRTGQRKKIITPCTNDEKE